ncbi:MAG TPA: NHL repeat-containing protein [Candidatus Acidoferrales bacterium]|nr:NHL repeat-containing protein [Candidatus Acidoferrales bacterium]
MRRLRIMCAVTVLALVGFATALKLPTVARAQTKSSAIPSSTQSSSTKAASNASQSNTNAAQSNVPQTIASANSNAPITIAANISARSLAVQPQLPSATNAATAENSGALQSALVFLTNADKGNKIFTLATSMNAPAGTNGPSGSLSAASKIALFAGQAAAGSLGDGGAASGAEFDLALDSLAMRSGVAVAPDGTFFVADTLNGTIRSIAGAASSEPGIVRSVVGRFGPRQNFELVEPLGLALDRAGNLYIADHGANAVLMLHAATSRAPGALEILAHVVSPASVGVTLDGAKVFASSPDTGSIVEINSKTRSISTSAISTSQWFAESQKPTGAKIIPTGLAVDGAGNVFVSFSGPGGGLDQIWRLDAVSGKVTSAARGLSSPGELAFDSNGNLFVADQGTHRLLEFRGAGVPSNGVTLTPPAGPVPTDFGLEPVDGTTATQAFTLTNNSGGTISQIGSSFQSGMVNFKVANTSCTPTLLTDTSCAFNVAFTPQSSSALSDNLVATFAAGANPLSTLTASVTGTGDDYQIMLASGGIQQITVNPGVAATFLLQIVPDDMFSGQVTLTCPAVLPTSTTCGISAGTTVTTPLVPSMMVNVVAGTPLPFNVTFQTTAKGTPAPAMIGILPTVRGQGGNSSRSSDSAQVSLRSFSSVAFSTFAILAVFLFATCALGAFRKDLAGWNAMRAGLANLCRHSIPSMSLRRTISTAALLIIVATALSSCGGSSTRTFPATPKGTTNLTVQGLAQGATRGFVVTLVVN